MSDPFRLFADASSGEQEMLKAVWPALYETLARLDRPAAERVVVCAVIKAHGVNDRPASVGRLTEDGPPACAACIELAASRPGGFPLTREIK